MPIMARPYQQEFFFPGQFLSAYYCLPRKDHNEAFHDLDETQKNPSTVLFFKKLFHEFIPICSCRHYM